MSALGTSLAPPGELDRAPLVLAALLFLALVPLRFFTPVAVRASLHRLARLWRCLAFCGRSSGAGELLRASERLGSGLGFGGRTLLWLDDGLIAGPE